MRSGMSADRQGADERRRADALGAGLADVGDVAHAQVAQVADAKMPAW